MSSRYVPYSMETTSRSRTSKRRRGNHDRDEFSPPSSAGERAWDYLLRRKAEDINDRIHKTKAVEVDCCSLPEETRGSSNYVPDVGFWIDRTYRERYYNEETCVKSEYDEFESEAARVRPKLESHCSSYSRHTANKHEGYGRSVPPSQRSEEALMLHVASYIEDARQYGAWANNVKRTKPKISKDSEKADHFREDYYKNVADDTTDYNTSNDGLSHFQESYEESTCHATRQIYGRKFPDQGESDHAIRQTYEGRFPDQEESDHATRQTFGGRFPDEGESDHATRQTYGGRFPDEGESDHATRQTYGGRFPDEGESDHATRQTYRGRFSDQGESDHATRQTYGGRFPDQGDSIHATRQTYGGRFPDQAESDHATRQTYGGKFPDQGSTQGLPSDSDDLRHLINNNPRRTFSASHPSASAVIPNMHSTSALTQSSKKSYPVTTGNHTFIHTLPYPAEGVEVVYTEDPVEAEAWLRNNIIDCSESAVGLDIEWKPQFKSKKKGGTENKTAVLQLGLESSCLVLHLHSMKKYPKSLSGILKNPEIVKIGSGILQDVTKLKKDTGLECIGLLDTQRIAKSMNLPPSQTLGLKSLAKYFLGFQLEKPKSVSMSNWEQFPLTIKQIHYAALDAWVGFKIYQHIKVVCGDPHQFQDESKADGNDVKNPAEKISCHVCKKKVKDRNGLTQHLRHHPKCECGEYFMSKIPKRHKKECPVRNSSATVPVLDDACKEPGWCQGCGKKCETKEKLMRHIREVCHVLCPFCTRLLNSSASSLHIRRCKDYVGEQWQQLAEM